MKVIGCLFLFFTLFMFPLWLSGQSLQQLRQSEFEETSGKVLSIEERYYTGWQMPADEVFWKQKDKFLNKITCKTYHISSNTFTIQVYLAEDTYTPRQQTQYRFNQWGAKISYSLQDIYSHVAINNHLVYQQQLLMADSLFMIDIKGNDSLLSVFQYKYDSKKRLAEEKEFTAGRSLEQRKTYSYNQQGELWEKKWYVGKNDFYNVPACGEKNHHWFSADTAFYRKWTYLYDNKGNLTGEAEFTHTNCKLWEKQWTFDQKGNKLKEVSIEFGKIRSIRTGFYDKQKRLTEEWYRSETGEIFSHCTYYYNTTGDLIEINCFDKDNAPTTSVRKSYDAYGNWIVKEVKNRGKLSSLTERKISYK